MLNILLKDTCVGQIEVRKISRKALYNFFGDTVAIGEVQFCETRREKKSTIVSESPTVGKVQFVEFVRGEGCDCKIGNFISRKIDRKKTFWEAVDFYVCDREPQTSVQVECVEICEQRKSVSLQFVAIGESEVP